MSGAGGRSGSGRRAGAGPLYAGIDLGTTNVKAVIAEEDGRIVAAGGAAVGISYGGDGSAEQDIEDIWRAARAALRQAAAAVDAGRVRAIGVSSQGGALQVLDAHEAPVGPVIGWQDARGGPCSARLEAEYGWAWFVERTGFPGFGSSVGQLLRLREQGALPRGFRLGFVGDVIVGRLCGRRAQDATSLSEEALLNPRLGREDPDVLALVGLEASQLPALLPVTGAAGGLLPPMARELGLPEGIPVGPAVHDQYAAAVGCGTVRAGDTMLGAGTAWVLLAVTDRLEPPVAGLAVAGRHPVEGLFGQMLSMVNGGACISWAVRTLNLGSPGVAELDALMQQAPAGCDGLSFRPLLSELGGGGLRPGAAGSLEGLRLGHTPAHIVRALVEGLACELDRYLELVARGGVRVSRLVLCGKAASSTVTPQVIADTTGLPVDCASLAETSSLGAAVFARCMTSPGPGLVALADAMKPALRRVAPGPASPAARQRSTAYAASLARHAEEGR